MDTKMNVSTKNFSINSKYKIFSAEVSSFKDGFVDIINLKSEKTGKVSKWVKWCTEMSEENELLFVDYVPWELDKFPSLKGWKLTIFNT
jgi:hypothetical protein